MNANQFEKSNYFDIEGVLYIGNTKPHTAMYVSKKIEGYLENLRKLSQCLVFVETGVKIPKDIENDHLFIQVDNPQLAYAKLAGQIETERKLNDMKKIYSLKNGKYISETAQIGNDVFIFPGCWIGHNVVIGDNSTILTGAVINHAVIGKNFIANEYAVIGTNGFTIADNENGDKIRIPSLGNVIIGNNVEVGVHDNISRGTAGVIVGGYDVIEEGVFVGLNATLKNRIHVERDSIIGMGAIILKDVGKLEIMVGNPGKKLARGYYLRGNSALIQNTRWAA